MESRQGRRDPSLNYLKALVRPSWLLGLAHCVVSMFLVLNSAGRAYQPIPDPMHPVVLVLTIVLLAPSILAAPCLISPVGPLLLPLNSVVWIVAMRAIGRRILARRRKSREEAGAET